MQRKYRIEVTARAEYVSEQSDPDSERYVFAYHIRIANTGEATARLISRHWIITDADAQIQEVKGDGVIGEQPLLAAGQHFEYSSGCVITTPVGTMQGSYLMEGEGGERFEAAIPEFVLPGPRTLH